MCGVSLKNNLATAELCERMGVEAISDVLRRGRLRWFGHVLRKDDGNWTKRVMSYEVTGAKGRGRPKMMWRHVVERDMRSVGLRRRDADDRARWRRLLWQNRPTPASAGKTAVKRL